MQDAVAPPVVDHTVVPDGERWVFDQSVTDVFEDMLLRSIPEYATMRRLSFEVGRRFVKPGTAIVALGCSRGEDLAPYLDAFGAANRYVGLDSSEPMVEAARERFGTFGGLVDVRVHEAGRDRHPANPASLTLAILALMFVPVEHRQRLLRDVYRATVPGGALVIVEKCLASNEVGTDLMTGLYHAMKRWHGYSDEEVDSKARALEGVLVSWSPDELVRSLRAAGFRTVEPYWRAYQFAGWVAVRDDG